MAAIAFTLSRPETTPDPGVRAHRAAQVRLLGCCSFVVIRGPRIRIVAESGLCARCAGELRRICRDAGLTLGEDLVD